MARFEPAPQDDHIGRDFEDFPEIAEALRDLAAPKDLRGDLHGGSDDVAGRLSPEDVDFDDDSGEEE